MLVRSVDIRGGINVCLCVTHLKIRIQGIVIWDFVRMFWSVKLKRKNERKDY